MTKLESLQNVFTNRAFVVPDYQRGYAWEQEQRQDLLNDLEDLEQVEIGKTHYTGTLVLHQGQRESATVRGQRFEVVDIVDGQQRLTTLVIFLHVIAEKLRLVDNDPIALETAQMIEEEYIQRKSAQGALSRLTLNGGADQFFRDHVLGSVPNPDTTLPAHANLLNAKVEFSKYIKERCTGLDTEVECVPFLLELIQHVTNRLGFVVYEVESEAEVGVMFEVMNARGRPLTDLEKVKNYLLYVGTRVSSDAQSLSTLSREVNGTWRRILESIVAAGSQGDEDQFLRYHWAIYPKAEWYAEGKRARTFDIHRAVKETLNLRKKTPDVLFSGIGDYLASVRSLVISYRNVLNPRYPTAFQEAGAEREGLVDSAQTLKRIGRTATVLPILMAAHHCYSGDVLALQEIFRLAEVFVFRLAASERNANTGDSYAYTIAANIMLGKLDAQKAAQELRGLILYYCTDAQLRASLNDPDRDFYAWPALKYFLYEYERQLFADAKQKFSVDWEQFFRRGKDDTIEHVLPQGERTLSVLYWGERFTRERFLSCRHSLGNLCLTDWNSSYSNKPFTEKRGNAESPREACVYQNSRWRMEKDICIYADWNEENIKKRQSVLVDFALRRWRV